MARRSYNSYRRGKSRRRKWKWVLGLLVLVVVLGFIFRSGEDEQVEANEELAEVEVFEEPVRMQIELEKLPPPEPELVKVIPVATDESDPKVTELIDQAKLLIDNKPAKTIEARDVLNEALPLAMSPQQRLYVKNEMSKLSDRWLFSRTVYEGDRLCSLYKVQPGDQLRTIGKKFGVPYEILMQINGIKRAESLQAGVSIKIINGPFHAKVYLSSFMLDLYLKNTFVKSFSVGVGKEGRETPTGLWVVESGGKVIKPSWTDPDTGKRYEAEDPDYPLGSRWIGLEGIKGNAVGRTGFALHGTKNVEEIGTANSRGCIRLHNGNVILMYNVLREGQSQVMVVK